MCNNSKNELLLLEEEFKSHTSENEIKNLKKIQKEIFNNYFEELRAINIKKSEYTKSVFSNLNESFLQEKIAKDYNLKEEQRIERLLENWMLNILIKKCPKNFQKTKEELAKDMIISLKKLESLQNSFNLASKNGISKESWFSKQIIDHTSYMKPLENKKYMENLIDSLNSLKNPLYEAVSIQTKILYQDHELDHFISEQYLVNKFNHKSLENGSFYKADLLKNEKKFKKQSVSPVKIIITEGHINIFKCFYPKYFKELTCEINKIESSLKEPKHKKKYFENYSYLNINGFSTKIESPDAIISDFLVDSFDKDATNLKYSKDRVKIQWNDYEKKNFLFEISKRFFDIDVFSFIINKNNNFKNKNVSTSAKEYFEKLENSLLNESDFGIKLAVFTSLLIVSEKEEFKAIPKGTNLDIIASIAFLSVENFKSSIKFCDEGPKDKEKHMMMRIKNMLGVSITNMAIASDEYWKFKENLNIFLGPLVPTEENSKNKNSFLKFLKVLF